MLHQGNQQTVKSGALKAALSLLMAASISQAGQGQGKGPASKKSIPATSAAKMQGTRTSVAGVSQSQVEKTAGPRGRDPFNVPPASIPGPRNSKWTAGSDVSEHLPPGARGLVISQLSLEGVVVMHGSPGLIAVVTNPSHIAYFLHENETLYDGVVTKITPQAVFFNENVRNDDGRAVARQVVRRLH